MNDPLNHLLDKLDNVKQIKRGEYMASCPGRRDDTPSLSVTMAEDGSKVLLHDFGGSAPEEVVAALGMGMTDLFADDPRGRREWVREQQTIQREKKRRAYKRPVVPEDASFKQGAINWFAKRGISEATMQHFGIYTIERFFHKANGTTPAICIPYRSGGETVNVKYRSATVKDFAMEEGAEPCWFNLDAVVGHADVIIVEGEMDVMALYEAGITNAISPPNGCQSLTKEVMESGDAFLADETVRIILAGDTDEPGRKMMDEIARRVGKERCAAVRWPEGCKDANDLLVANGPQGVVQCVHEASPLPFDGVVDPDALLESMWAIYAGGLPRGTSTGIAILDQHYTVLPGYWTLITGSPSAGKTAFINQLCVNIAEREGWHFGVCSLENPDAGLHGIDIVTQHGRKSISATRADRMTAEEFDGNANWAKDYFHFVKPEEPSLEAVLRSAKGLVFAHGIKGLVIDPWNEIEHPPAGMNSGDYISRCLTMVRQFAYRYGVHIWLVAHPTKLNKDADGQYPVPTLYDVSGSAHFFNKADYGIAIWRNWLVSDALVDIHIQKSRRREIASRGCVQLRFDSPTARYYDPKAEGEQNGGEWRPAFPWERQRAAETPFDLAAEESAAADG